MKFSSLRWRIATFYALLLAGVIGAVGIVLGFQLRAILLDEARAKVDRVGEDITEVVRGNSLLGAIGEGLPIEEQLTSPGTLDHWAGPTTFVQIDTAKGYPVGKSTNMGSAAFTAPTAAPNRTPAYGIETAGALGDVLVRDELVTTPGTASLHVEVGESLAIYDQTLGRIRTLIVVVVAFAALAVVAGSFLISSGAVGPISRLIAAMSEIRSDRLSRRLGWTGRRDELGALAQSFDAMLERLEEGFARERRFISDASHELKTPLTVINANAQMLERWADRDPDIRAESLRAIKDESASLAAMVNGMLLLAKAESGDDIPREALDLRTVIGEAVRSAAPRAAEKSLALEFAPPEQPVEVLGDANLLRQLFTNLIENAIKFTENGSIEVTLAEKDDLAVAAVADTGVGIDEDALERVFDRFYRTDASRNRAVPGTGLGLAIARSIARVHGGTIAAERRSGGGTIFRISIPTLTPRS